jgi:hypothetical protein
MFLVKAVNRGNTIIPGLRHSTDAVVFSKISGSGIVLADRKSELRTRCGWKVGREWHMGNKRAAET